MDDPDRRPGGSNADEWAMFLDDHRNADGFLAVQIAEAIEEAERRGMMRAIKAIQNPPGSFIPVPDNADGASYALGYAHGKKDAGEAIESAATEEGE